MSLALFALLGVSAIGWFMLRLALERDYWHWAPLVARGLTRLAASLLPHGDRERWHDEWLAEVDAASKVRSSGLIFALGLLLVAVPTLTLRELRRQGGGVLRAGIYAAMLFLPIHIAITDIAGFGNSRAAIALSLFTVLTITAFLYRPPLHSKALAAFAGLSVALSALPWNAPQQVALVAAMSYSAVLVFDAVDEWAASHLGATAARVAALVRMSLAYAVINDQVFHLDLYRLMTWGLLPLLSPAIVYIFPKLPWRRLLKAMAMCGAAGTGTFLLVSSVLEGSPVAGLATAVAAAWITGVWNWTRLNRQEDLMRGLFILGTDAARRSSERGGPPGEGRGASQETDTAR